MSLFDMSVIFFFFVIAVKGISDLFSFWRETDMIAATGTPSPAYRPAPVRRSPASLRINSANRAQTTIRPIRVSGAAVTSLYNEDDAA